MQENHTHAPHPNMRPARQQRAVAVAIQADENIPEAPAQITASGRGKIAEQILDIAFQNGIKVREDQGLAEILAQLELDTPIPSEAIITVAEILAKVYEANGIAAQAHSMSTMKGTP